MNTAIERNAKATATIEPLLSMNDVAAALNCSRRAVEAMRASGRFPKPDAMVGRCPRWKRETVTRWIDNGGAK